MDATLQSSQAANRIWDVIVVGAGPAGAMAACELSRLGCSVLLVDKASFPRDKVCGCCLNRRALEILDSRQLAGLVRETRAQKLDRLVLASAGRQVQLRLGHGFSVSRAVLDAALVRAAVEAGVCFLPATRAELLRCTAEHWLVQLTCAEHRASVEGRIVLAADGLGGRLLGRLRPAGESVYRHSRVGAGVIAEGAAGRYEPGRIFMACGAGGYVGLVRLEDGRLDVAAALDPDHVRRSGGLGPAASTILQRAGLPNIKDLARLPWRGTPLLTRHPDSVAHERLFALGDAAGYVEPFTGEGIAWALASAVQLAPLARQAAVRWESDLAAEWNDTYHRLFRRRQRLCRTLATLLRHPVLLNGLVRLLSRAPVLAQPVLSSLHASNRHHPVGVRPPGRVRV